MKYGYVKEIDLTFDVALEKVGEELQKEGFKVLTTIDVQAKFKEKLNIDFPKYMILGACNPKLAHKAISIEWDIGLLLPCNIIVYEKDGRVGFGVMKPSVGSYDMGIRRCVYVVNITDSGWRSDILCNARR
jgi:uncharacterized protein (DUF302 family)